jgi:hypothetical protein
VTVIGASSDAARRRSKLPPGAAPIVDRRERFREGLSATARRPGMDDPALLLVLDEEGVERNQQLRQGECVPAAPDLDLDLDRGRRFVLSRMWVHLSLLDSLASSVSPVRPARYAVIAPSIPRRDLMCVAVS